MIIFSKLIYKFNKISLGFLVENEKKILKLGNWKELEKQTKKISEKEEQSWGLTLSDFKNYYKTTVDWKL